MASPEPIFVDTNVFLRVLTRDDVAKARRSAALFEQARRGEQALWTSPLVIAEIIWTLESFYGLARKDIADRVEKILNTPGLEVLENDRLLSAIDLYATKNVDFIDAYHGCMLRDRGLPRVATYDRKHFKRMPWLERIEP